MARTNISYCTFSWVARLRVFPWSRMQCASRMPRVINCMTVSLPMQRSSSHLLVLRMYSKSGSVGMHCRAAQVNEVVAIQSVSVHTNASTCSHAPSAARMRPNVKRAKGDGL